MAGGPDIRSSVDWAISLIGTREWKSRQAILESFAKNQNPSLQAATANQSQSLGFNFPIAPEDRAGWYLYQVELYLIDPYDCDLPQCERILPVFNQLGNRLSDIVRTPGATGRMQRAQSNSGLNFDSTLFELTLAPALLKHGFSDIAFVPECSNTKTPDLKMLRNGQDFYVECKRKKKMSDYPRQ